MRLSTSRFFGFLLIISWSSLSCRSSEQDSTVKIVNGQQTSAYPAVQFIELKRTVGQKTLQGICSITFVSDNTALTAGHCTYNESLKELDGNPQWRPEEVTLNGGAVKAKAIIGMERPSANIIDSEDFAILVFPDNSAKQFVPLAKNIPAAGQSVSIVGFGKSFNGKDSGTGSDSRIKRAGTNKVSRVEDNVIFITGLKVDQGQKSNQKEAMSAPGDSGGPLFITENGRSVIAGTCIGMIEPQDIAPKVASAYLSVNSALARNKMAIAKSRGARFSDNPNNNIPSPETNPVVPDSGISGNVFPPQNPNINPVIPNNGANDDLLPPIPTPGKPPSSAGCPQGSTMKSWVGNSLPADYRRYLEGLGIKIRPTGISYACTCNDGRPLFGYPLPSCDSSR